MNRAATSATGTPPVAIGGVGGSGTRLVALLLRKLGFHLGDDLNVASDTLWFTLLFKRLDILDCDDVEFGASLDALVAALRGGRKLDARTLALVERISGEDRPQHTAEWLRQRAATLRAAAMRPARSGRWGWKEPNTHVVIERLWRHLPDLRYVHVVRNGLDMAFSTNQNQLRLWGPRTLGGPDTVTPARSLAYWCHVHRRMQVLQQENPERIYWLDYDALCRSPRASAAQLCTFLGIQADALDAAFGDLCVAPRRRGGDLRSLAACDVDYVRSLGYATALEEA